MKMPPIAMVGDAYIAHLLRAVRVLNGYRQGLSSMCGGYDTTISKGLLDKAIVLLYQADLISVQFLVPLNGTEIR